MQLDTLLLTTGAAAAEDARQFAAAGIDGVFTFEGPGDPFVPLTLAAMVSDLWISTSVALAFVRSPMSLAYTAWDLQRLSRGRFLLGLGTQVRANVEDRYGADFSRPVVRMRETVEAIHAIFDRWQHGTPLTFVGETTRHTLMQPLFDPGPLEWGPPPVLVGALGPQMTRMASRVADGVIVHPVMTPRYLADTTASNIAAGLARAGRDRSRPHGRVRRHRRDRPRRPRDGDRARGRALAAVLLPVDPCVRRALEPYGWEGLQPGAQHPLEAGSLGRRWSRSSTTRSSRRWPWWATRRRSRPPSGSGSTPSLPIGSGSTCPTRRPPIWSATSWPRSGTSRTRR